MSRRRTSYRGPAKLRANVLLLSNEGDSLPCDPNTVREWFQHYEKTFFQSALLAASRAVFVQTHATHEAAPGRVYTPGDVMYYGIPDVRSPNYGFPADNLVEARMQTYAYGLMLEFAEALGIEKFIDRDRLALAEQREKELRAIVASLSEQLASFSRGYPVDKKALLDISHEIKRIRPKTIGY